MYRKYGDANYHELYNKDTNTVTWYSDDDGYYVTIIKKEDAFEVSFHASVNYEDYDHSYMPSLNTISIRFRNSGSRYSPFNIVFMKMYDDLKNIDDVNEDGHQIHIDEYLYTKNKVLKK